MNPADTPGKQPILPGDLAMVDQHAAELGGLVTTARRHMRVCPSVPHGVCIGQATQEAIESLSWAQMGNLLQEAVAQIARAAPAEDRP